MPLYSPVCSTASLLSREVFRNIFCENQYTKGRCVLSLYNSASQVSPSPLFVHGVRITYQIQKDNIIEKITLKKDERIQMNTNEQICAKFISDESYLTIGKTIDVFTPSIQLINFLSTTATVSCCSLPLCNLYHIQII